MDHDVDLGFKRFHISFSAHISIKVQNRNKWVNVGVILEFEWIENCLIDFFIFVLIASRLFLLKSFLPMVDIRVWEKLIFSEEEEIFHFWLLRSRLDQTRLQNFRLVMLFLRLFYAKISISLSLSLSPLILSDRICCSDSIDLATNASLLKFELRCFMICWFSLLDILMDAYRSSFLCILVDWKVNLWHDINEFRIRSFHFSEIFVAFSYTIMSYICRDSDQFNFKWC